MLLFCAIGVICELVLAFRLMIIKISVFAHN